MQNISYPVHRLFYGRHQTTQKCVFSHAHCSEGEMTVVCEKENKDQ